MTPTGKEKTVDVTVNDQTVIETAAGKALPLKDLKAGDGLGIAHAAGLASKIVVDVKPAELTGHVKSVGANLKTFVVTETGTDDRRHRRRHARDLDRHHRRQEDRAEGAEEGRRRGDLPRQQRRLQGRRQRQAGRVSARPSNGPGPPAGIGGPSPAPS